MKKKIRRETYIDFSAVEELIKKDPKFFGLNFEAQKGLSCFRDTRNRYSDDDYYDCFSVTFEDLESDEEERKREKIEKINEEKKERAKKKKEETKAARDLVTLERLRREYPEKFQK